MTLQRMRAGLLRCVAPIHNLWHQALKQFFRLLLRVREPEIE
jgi:hypothetical protein